MKKSVILIFSIFLLASCSVPREAYTPGLWIYSLGGVHGSCLPEYFILLNAPAIYLENHPFGPGTFYGEWETHNDTLILLPQFHSHAKTSWHPVGYCTNIGNVPRTFLMKEDRIIEITDYYGLLSDNHTTKEKLDSMWLSSLIKKSEERTEFIRINAVARKRLFGTRIKVDHTPYKWVDDLELELKKLF